MFNNSGAFAQSFPMEFSLSGLRGLVTDQLVALHADHSDPRQRQPLPYETFRENALTLLMLLYPELRDSIRQVVDLRTALSRLDPVDHPNALDLLSDDLFNVKHKPEHSDHRIVLHFVDVLVRETLRLSRSASASPSSMSAPHCLELDPAVFADFDIQRDLKYHVELLDEQADESADET